MPEFREKHTDLHVTAFQVPKRDEEPSEAMVDFLHENTCEWEGDGEGIVLHSYLGISNAWPGDWICRCDGRYFVCPETLFTSTYEEIK